jgi:hypothetical protein
MGYFRIESLGRVIDADRREVANEKLVVTAKLFDVYRDTTQADFQRDLYLNDDNTALQPPGNVESELRKTFSASGAATSYASSGHLACYPELYYKPAYVQTSTYSGYVGLMPKESLSGGGGADFRARFGSSFDADKGGEFLIDPGGGPWLDRMVGGAKPGCLMQDGVLSDLDAAPGYDNRDGSSFNQHNGAILFWAKPAFDPEYTGFNRMLFSVISYDLQHDPYAYWSDNPFAIGYMMFHRIVGSKDEKWDDIAYNTGSSRLFLRSIYNGYSGAFTRVGQTWNKQKELCGNEMHERNNFNGTPTLNHAGHGHDFIDKGGYKWGNQMVRGRWIHVAMVWSDWVQVQGFIQDYTNGTSVPWLKDPGQDTGQNIGACNYWNMNTVWGPPFGPLEGGNQMVTMRTEPVPTQNFGCPPEIPNASKISFVGDVPVLGGKSVPGKLFGGGIGPGQPNPPPIRLGCVGRSPLKSAFGKSMWPGDPAYPQNFPASAATLDEVLIFTTPDYAEHRKRVLDAWKDGRYYKSYGAPSKGGGTGGGGGTLARFTSGRVRFDLATQRSVPPRSPAPPPAGGTSDGTGTAATKVPPPTVRLGLVQYTMRVPNYEEIGKGFPTEYTAGTVPKPVPKVYFDILDMGRTSLLDGSAVLGYDEPTLAYMATAGGGPVTRDGKADGQPLDVDASKSVRYRFWLDSGLADPLNEPYTATPIIDDVTFTFSRAQPEILGWTVAN